MIRIRSSWDKFRRGGIAHPAKETCYPEDFFSEKNLEAIKNESKLVVETGLEPTGPEYASEKELKGACKEAGIEVIGTEPREHLVAAIRKHMAEVKDNHPATEGDGALLAAARQAIAEGKTIGSGAPDIKAMEEILRSDVTATERDAAWKTIQAEQGE